MSLLKFALDLSDTDIHVSPKLLKYDLSHHVTNKRWWLLQPRLKQDATIFIGGQMNQGEAEWLQHVHDSNEVLKWL